MVSVAIRSKAYVCYRLFAGIAGSNPRLPTPDKVENLPGDWPDCTCRELHSVSLTLHENTQQGRTLKSTADQKVLAKPSGWPRTRWGEDNDMRHGRDCTEHPLGCHAREEYS